MAQNTDICGSVLNDVTKGSLDICLMAKMLANSGNASM